MKIATRLLYIIYMIHNTGVSHNDITLDNILFNGTQLRIIDFGMAEIGKPMYNDMRNIGLVFYKLLEPNAVKQIHKTTYSIREYEAAFAGFPELITIKKLLGGLLTHNPKKRFDALTAFNMVDSK